MRQQNRNNQLVNKLKMLLFTTLTAVFISAVLLVLSAVLLDKLGLNAGQVRILIYAVYIVSALAAGLIAGKWQR
ncbi:MAG: TIGR04086 family membrane protein, partial [Lachnospiraceae bacterium]|nr:TIGR04086 family membrane protein [Lachnospiraceae bacterium]